MSKKGTVLAALAGAALLLAAGCATPDEAGSAGELFVDYDLRVATAAPGSLDPAKVDTEPARWLVKLICDPLVGFDPTTGELRPAVAESWTVSDDARRVTFTLRKGVTFHNGQELVAGDYVLSLSRIVRPETESPFHHLLEKVVGYPQVRSEQVPFLAGVTAPDPQTLVIELSEPFAPFPAVLANPSVGAAVPAEALDDPDRNFDVMPVCTGPYKTDAPTGGEEQIRLVRHEQYRGLDPSARVAWRGYPGTISWRIAADASDAYEMLDAGRVDVAPVPHSMLSEARRVPDRVSSGPSGHLTYIGLPVNRAGFDSPAARRALSLGVNRSAIVRDLLGGTRDIADGFLPVSAGPAASLSGCADSFPPEPRPTEAQGDALPDSFNLYLNSSGGHESWLRAVVNQWSMTLGAQGSLESMDWDPYLAFLKDPGADGPFQLSWVATYPSPESLLEPLFASDSLDNFTGYASTEFDDLLARAAATRDPAERSSHYSQATQVLCRDVPAIPMWFGSDHVAFGPEVAATGEQRIDIYGDPLLRELKGRE